MHALETRRRQAGMSGGIILIHLFIAVEIDVQNVENASEHGGGTA
jgi:hypothetical protein